jgi:hypothetical protein
VVDEMEVLVCLLFLFLRADVYPGPEKLFFNIGEDGMVSEI